MTDADEIVKESSESIGEITSIIQDVKMSITHLNKMSLEQKNTTSEMEKAMEEVAIAVEETHNITCNSIKLVDLQHNKNNEILSFCNKISDIAEDLQKEAVNFKKENEVIFGVNPFLEPKTIKKMYVPIIERVCSNIGIKARIIIVKSYDALSEGIEKGIIDIGWFSPFAYVNAHDRIGVKPVVTPIVNGKSSYNGYIIAHKNSSIKNIKDIVGKSFAYVDKKSASGYLYARESIKNSNMNPDNIFSKVVFLGSHDNVIKAVLDKEIDVGATFNEAIENFKSKGINIDTLNIISKTEDIPKDALAARIDLSDELIEKLKEAFIEFKDYKNIDTKVEGFIESEDKQYDIIRKINVK